MKEKLLEEKVELPEGINVTVNEKEVSVNGPKGELKKVFPNPKINIKTENSKIIFSAKNATKREKKMLKTYIALMRNLIIGVNEGYTYKLKICSSHFPMNVSVKDNDFEVKNFIGEKVPRILKLKSNVTVKVDGEIVIVESIDKEIAGQTAASIEQLTRRPGFDKRIFQDGIYITKKHDKIIK